VTHRGHREERGWRLAARFARPLFSSVYELPFSQLRCFQKLLRCPMFFPNSSPKGKSKMTQSASKPRFINNSARCNYRFPNGMRCRLIGFGSQPFCPKHTQSCRRTSTRRRTPTQPRRGRLHPHRQPRRLHFRRADQRFPLAPAPPARARQNLHAPRRRPRVHHQPTPAHPPGDRQRGKR
jgi:hypothetical protein